jgi:quercetin dioxygenase-like cupin family protein
MVRVVASGPSFDATVATFTDELGFRLDLIRPADDPELATLSRGELIVEVVRDGAPASVGAESTPDELDLPDLERELIVTRADDDADWITGRAGMRYRDLIPGRLGGRFIASNIEVCDGGPVPDLVHHHAIRFQIIVCQRGWVDVVYEDQGAPFRMNEGDAVLQPPHIRHRVLASSAGARVVEIGCPASHDTLFDHDLELPNDHVDPDRRWHGQGFVRHVGAEAPWVDQDGFEAQVTGIAEATDGLADVRLLRPNGSATIAGQGHCGELHFVFALAGGGRLHVDGQTIDFSTGASVTLTPDTPFRLDELTPATRLLDVRLPAGP